MLSRLLRQFLFTVLHLVVNILVAIQNVYYKFWNQNYNLNIKGVTKSEIKLLLETVPRITKKVNHLVVFADTDHHALGDLAKVVIWSLVIGIPFVSFYDATAQLKKNEEELFHEVEKNKKGIPGCIKWFKKPNLNGYTNGVQAHTVVLNIFTYMDGKPKIAQCIRQIAEEGLTCNRESTEYSAQELQDAFKIMYPYIPDPDLVLYTGPKCSTRGLLPWHIRLTEFVQLSLDHNVNIDSYVGALYKYNKCDQRFGK